MLARFRRVRELLDWGATLLVDIGECRLVERGIGTGGEVLEDESVRRQVFLLS